MNACYGGTLYQDLEREYNSSIDHHMKPPYDRTVHQVTIQKDTPLYHILKKSGLDTVLSGNIGIPAFDILEEIHPDTQLVCELSCHQLEYIHVSPISVCC